MGALRTFLLTSFLLAAVNVAYADDASPSDGGVDATPVPSTEPAPPPAVESTPPPAPTPPPAAPVDDDTDDDGEHGAKKHDKKHHDSHAGEGDDAGGDLISNDDVGGVSVHQVQFRFLLQPRYQQTFVKEPLDETKVLDPRLDDGYSINRAFLRATASPAPWLEAKVLADFAEFQHRNPKRALKLAYAELKPTKQVHVMVGLFKRTVSLLELLPIAEYELANIGPTDDLLKSTELGGRDIGVSVQWSPLRKKRWLTLSLAMFGGDVNGAEARPWGLVTGRIAARPTKHWQLGIDGGWRQHGEDTPAGVPASPGEGHIVSADVTYKRKHYEVRGEWVTGTRSDEAFAGQAKTWMAAWGLAAVRIGALGHIVMPALRFEWLDADREHPIGRRIYVTGGVNVMNINDTVRVLLDVSRSQVQRGTMPLGIAPVLLDVSSTVVVAQCQIKI